MSRIGHVVGRYRLVAEVAHGGMATVYAAVGVEQALGFQKVFACKLIHAHLAGEDHFVEMFVDEARIAAKIQHPNVVQVIEVGTVDEIPFLVMEYLRGQTLAKIIKKKPPRAHLFRILADVAEGLHAAHEARDLHGQLLNVVHRDVSPQNVHVGFDGGVKVLDFGVASAKGKLNVTRTGEVRGKIGYLAPEQIAGTRGVTRTVDVWAFGVLAWESIARRRLFRADDDAKTIWNVLNLEVPSIADVDVPEEVDRAVRRCLSREVSERPETLLELARVFRRYSADTTSVDLGEWMADQFATEKGVENERLAAALRSEPPPPLREASSSEVLSEPSRSLPRAPSYPVGGGSAAPARVPTWVWGVVAASALVVLLVGAAGIGSALTAARPTVVATRPIAASRAVAIARAAREVSVDGQIVARGVSAGGEVMVPILEGQAATVAVTWLDGTSESFAVASSEVGRVLGAVAPTAALAAPPSTVTAPAAATPTPATPTAATAPATPVVAVPTGAAIEAVPATPGAATPGAATPTRGAAAGLVRDPVRPTEPTPRPRVAETPRTRPTTPTEPRTRPTTPTEPRPADGRRTPRPTARPAEPAGGNTGSSALAPSPY